VPDGELFQVKVDIEGFEKDLFGSNLDWLDQVDAVFIEPHDWLLPEDRTSRAFQQALAARDFSMLLCGENLIYIANARRAASIDPGQENPAGEAPAIPLPACPEPA